MGVHEGWGCMRGGLHEGCGCMRGGCGGGWGCRYIVYSLKILHYSILRGDGKYISSVGERNIAGILG